ncbi:unnamed protein product [Lactuca saligna]|uniref:Uncharacterized protein n=1 Tax=Lactuca saligna TaxID=75948 RepID=A0AA35ZFV2_LACSI|nr:unnamed protein product [Lactuca saligna]
MRHMNPNMTFLEFLEALVVDKVPLCIAKSIIQEVLRTCATWEAKGNLAFQSNECFSVLEKVVLLKEIHPDWAAEKSVLLTSEHGNPISDATSKQVLREW